MKARSASTEAHHTVHGTIRCRHLTSLYTNKEVFHLDFFFPPGNSTGHEYASWDMLEPRETDLPDLFLVFVVLPLVSYFILGKWGEIAKRKEGISLIFEREFEESPHNMAVCIVMTSVQMPNGDIRRCARCFGPASTRCSHCKSVWYCSGRCQITHGRQVHNLECQQLGNDYHSPSLKPISRERSCERMASAKTIEQCSSNDNVLQPNVDNAFPEDAHMIFPYEKFVKFFQSKVLNMTPRGFVNCGNSCYANAVLQCLMCTKPLMIYFLRQWHSRTGCAKDWCLMCELEQLVAMLRENGGPLSPVNIFMYIRSLNSQIGDGSQEDAHEFLRVKYLRCHHESERYENMMDLTLEIFGWVEICIDVQEAPNILTIVLKRFQDGNYGKIDKCITFLDMLDMIPFMTGTDDIPPLHMLYAVVLHLDMSNASFSGHYISYVKDLHGNWFKVDDTEVRLVDLSQVVSEAAYILFYMR
ncbi:ubiquitin-specific protease ubp15 [Orobanche minor]